MGPKWFRVIGCGLSGNTYRDSDAAWESFWREARRAGYREDECGTVLAAHEAVLIEATTKNAADNAHMSRAYGRIGRGEWWRA